MPPRARMALAIGALLGAAAIALPARQESPGALMEAARKAELLDGDVRGAIRQYQAILDRFGHDAAVAATAMVRMAGCYEKLGDARARTLYERVIRQYPQQKQAVATARRRLGSIVRAPARDGITLTQLTFNSAELPIAVASISPDGRHLAYADPAGVAVRALPSGAPRRMQLPVETAIEDIGWGADASLIVSTASTVWKASVGGGTPQRLVETGGLLAMSPDGTQFALTSSRSQIRLYSIAGEGPHDVVPAATHTIVSRATWSPDGRRIAYVLYSNASGRRQVSIETRLADGTGRTVLHSGPAQDLIWAPDGRLFFTRPSPPPKARYAELWQLPLDGSGRTIRPATRVTNAPDFTYHRPSMTADGRQLAFTRQRYVSDIVTAAFDRRRLELSSPERAVLHSQPSSRVSWTPNGDSLLFQIENDDGSSIHRQPAGGREPEVFIPTSRRPWGADYAPDGKTILYLSLGRGLMRARSAADPPELLQSMPGLTAAGAAVRCARPPARVCALGEAVGGSLRILEIDAAAGRITPVLDLPPAKSPESWDLSPDGTSLVMVPADRSNELVLLDVPSRSISRVPLGSLAGATFASWTADGTGWLMTRAAGERGSELVFLDRQGRSKTLWTSSYQRLGRAVVSPDGGRVAFASWIVESSAWMLRGF